MTPAPASAAPATEPIAVVSEKLPWQHTFTSLSQPNFRIFATGHLVATTAIWMQRIAQDWLVLELTGSVAAVGVTVALQFIPILLLSPIGGVITDRFPKRRLLMVTQSMAAMLAALMAVLALTGALEVWHIYLIAVALGLATVVDQPARQVFVTELVGPELMRNAISINSTIFQLGGLIGPTVAGVLLSAVGAGWAFAINALACCGTVLCLSLLRKDRLFLTPKVARAKGMVKEAFDYGMRKPAIHWTWVMAGVVSLFALSISVQLAAYADRVFDVGPGGYGLLNAMLATGAMIGALASARRRRLSLRTVVLSAAFYGLMLCSCALMPSMLSLCIMIVFAGIGSMAFVTAANQLVQSSSNVMIRGRVMSLYLVVLLGGQAISGPMMGFLAEHAGPHVSMFVAGMIPLLVAGILGIHLARTGELQLRVKMRRHLPVVVIAARS